MVTGQTTWVASYESIDGVFGTITINDVGFAISDVKSVNEISGI